LLQLRRWLLLWQEIQRIYQHAVSEHGEVQVGTGDAPRLANRAQNIATAQDVARFNVYAA
jgi:hypothetical protein